MTFRLSSFARIYIIPNIRKHLLVPYFLHPFLHSFNKPFLGVYYALATVLGRTAHLPMTVWSLPSSLGEETEKNQTDTHKITQRLINYRMSGLRSPWTRPLWKEGADF